MKLSGKLQNSWTFGPFMSCKKVYASFLGHLYFVPPNRCACTHTVRRNRDRVDADQVTQWNGGSCFVGESCFHSTDSSHETPPAANESEVVVASVSCDAELSKYLYEPGLASILLPFLILHLFELRSYCSHIYIVFKEFQTYDKL